MGAKEDLGRRLYLLEQGQKQFNAPRLAFTSLEPVGDAEANIPEYDVDGNLVALIGAQFDGSHLAASLSGPKPPRPSMPLLTPGKDQITTRFDGIFLNDAGVPDLTVIAPMDFARTEVHASLTMPATPDDYILADSLVGTVESPRGTDFTITPITGGPWYVWFIARSLSGKYGDPSPVATSTPLAEVTVQDPTTGDALGTISDGGDVSGRNLNIETDPVFMGRPLFGDFANFEHPSEGETSGALEFLPRSMLSRGFRAIGGMTVTTGEMELSEINFESTLSRAYRIHVTPFGAYVGANTYGYLNIRYTNDGSRPTMSSPLLHRQSVRNQNASSIMFSFGGTFYYLGGTAGTIRLLATLSSDGGAITVFNSGDGGDLRWWVEDAGLSVPDTGIDRTGRTGTTVTPPPEKKNYTQTWTASAYRSFYTSGGTYTYNTGKLYQGNSPAVGGLQSMVTFGNGSLGQSITTALSGATITSIKAYFYFDFWYYNSGGTAKIGVHGSASLTSSLPGSYAHAVTSDAWPKPGGRWVSIPSSFWAGFKSGTYRGLTLGDTSPSTIEYGYANGSKTRLEIKYTK